MPPPRGHILDRFGREIVTNRPSFNVALIQEDSHDLSDVLERLAPILDMEVSELWAKVREASGTPRYVPVLLKEDIDWKTLAYLENHNHEFSGIRTEVQPVRVYHYDDLAANVIGYLGSISKKELAASDRDVYSGGDIIGKRGLEKMREPDLRGEKGHSYTEVDSKGFEQQMLKTEEPLPGREIRLTLDVDLQQIAERLYGCRRQIRSCGCHGSQYRTRVGRGLCSYNPHKGLCGWDFNKEMAGFAR